jgi:hypothetical protein
MKPNKFMLVLALLCLFALVRPTVALSQPLTDSTVNFFTLSAYYDHFYDSLIQVRGLENMKGSGYTDYLRWKWFYTGRHGTGGNLNEVWESIQDYKENFQAPLESTDESDWKYAGPFEIPRGHGGISRKETGKGMILSLWVSGGNHSLIYAGSHHGGLWKTEDGGKNWYPLNDQDSEIHGVNSIAVDPSDYNTLYITSNSSLGSFSNYSTGLFKSTDGGISWDRLPTTITYPSGSWADKVRKILIHPNDHNTLFFLTYRNVLRSDDGGSNWNIVFERDYFPWSGNPDLLENHNGFFDFKITPWNSDLAYLAGSEIFVIENPTTVFHAENISDNVFLIGLDPEDIMINNPHRTEISMNENYPGVVWFCYACEYDRGDGVKNYLRIVRLDGEGYHLLLDEDISGYADIGVSGDKLEFIVSPSNQNIFYVGGIYLCQVNSKDGSSSMKSLSSGEYPDDCWIHADIRDMQIFSDGTHDTLYLANDAGVSWGTPYEDNPNGCGNGEWRWHHPFNSGENGLNVTEFYGIGLSKGYSELIAGGCQDLGDMLLNNGNWINFGGGDGSDLVWDPANPDIFYFTEWQNGFLYRTNDLGATSDHFGSVGKPSTVFMPMEVERNSDDPSNPYTILYSSRRDLVYPQYNGNLIKYSYVDNFDIQEFDPEVLHRFHDSLSDIEVVRIDQSSRKLYVSTFKSYIDDENPPEPEYYTGCIYRSKYENDQLDFDDISASLNGCLNGFIADIEVHPNQISKIWVAFANYSRDCQDSKVFTSINSGDSWEPFSDGLPPGMPVFNLRYLPEFNYLLAVTDVGVFKNDLQGEDWYPFNKNLPSKIVTDVDINRDLNTIVAATYGRGLWKTPLRCHYTGGSETLEQNKKWKITMLLEKSIIIPAGITLTIENCRVYLPTEAKIVVERGGTLVLDGATLTSACNDLWWGVEVHGDSRYEQLDGVQGKIILKNDAVIEKARKAIFCGKNIENTYPEWAYTGGIVDATDAWFINNRYGAMFWIYPFENVSTFTNCKFQTTEILADGSSPEFFMTMVKVHGIDIGGCSFKNLINSAPFMHNQGSAIFALDAGFEIYATNPPFNTRSQFNNLEYGIFAMKYAEDLEILIQDGLFIGNLTGVYASGIEGLKLYLNSFDVYRLDVHSNYIYGGVYLDHCTGYEIQENKFFGQTSAAEQVVGLTVNNSGEAYNILNNNIFNHLHIGTLAQNQNRSNDLYAGLKIICNDYTDNKYDIAITGHEGCKDCGIALYQGGPGDPAGNLFSLSGNFLYSDIHNEGTSIQYYHHDKDDLHPPNPWIPSYVSPNVTLIKLDIQYDVSYCNSQIPQGMTKSQYVYLYNDFTTISDSLKNLLDQLIDGGDTETLDMEITNSEPEEALELRSELIGKSPFLSDTILIKSALKEDVLPPAMVKEIMVANPQSAKSDKVMEALENRENPIPEYMMEEIMLGRDTIGQKELIEAEYSNAGFQKEIILNRLISLYRADTLNSGMDSIVQLLTNHNTISAKYRLMMTYLELNDTASAKNILLNIPQQFALTSSQALVYDHWSDYLETILVLKKNSLMLPEMDSLQVGKLVELAQYEDQPGCLAGNILHFLGKMELHPNYILPGNELKSMPDAESINKTGKQNKEQYFKLYPNPAKNYIVVEYILSDMSTNGVLYVYDSSGKLKFMTELPPNKHDVIIQTKDWSDGIYLFNFTSNGQYKQSEKLIIVQ